MKYSRLVILVIGFIFSSQVAAANQSADMVAQFVRTQMEKQRIPGLALLVPRNGEPIRLEGYGLSNVELEVRAKPERFFNRVRSASSSLQPP